MPLPNAPPLVTVCVPTTGGRPAYLELSLRALEEQSWTNLEILILDNASPPPAQGVLASFAARKPGSRILRVEERVPMFPNFNRGIREAEGDYIVFFHDDDIYDRRFIETLVAFLEAHPNAAFAGGNFDIIDGEGRLTRRENSIEATEVWDGHRFSEDLVRRGRSRISTPGLVFRRSVLQPLGFPEDVSLHWGDFYLLMRMAEQHGVGMLSEMLLQYRVHGGNASGISFSTTIPIRTEVTMRYCRGLRERRPSDAAFAARLERLVARTHVRDLLVGWLSAPDEAEAEACLRELASAAPRVARSLRAVQRLGLRTSRRRAALPLLRRLGRAFGM